VAKKNILVIGQTPPPIGGQAIMVERLMNGEYNDCELILNRMNFSKQLNESGKFSLKKIFHLFSIINKSFYHRFFNNAKFLIYHPGGPNKKSLIKDIIILLILRPFFNKIVLYFHAGGISNIYHKINPVFRLFFRLSFFHNDYGIKILEKSPNDPEFIQSKKINVIHIGVPDEYLGKKKIRSEKIKILFLGSVYRSKGVDDLIEAMIKISNKNQLFQLDLVGDIESNFYLKSLNEKIINNDLSKKIKYHGILTGIEKQNIFEDADIFVFPSYFHSENSPQSIIEAMSFELPIIATNWRGIPSLVHEDYNGFLIDLKDTQDLERKIIFLMKNKSERLRMGANSRKIYKEHFSMENYYNEHNKLFKEIVG